jgi:multicomponent Na+:H+ antiporter subunit E
MTTEHPGNPDVTSSRAVDAASQDPQILRGRRFLLYPFVLTFIVMFGIWVLLSGKFDPFHLSLGLISCGIVSFLSSDLLFASPKPRGLLGQWVRFIGYIPWLMLEIIKANLHVTYLVFHPRMMELIDPRIVKFRSRLKSDVALVTFANSITLTPGTITVYVSIDGDFKVHAIDKASGDPLPGEMEAHIAKAFGEV